MTMLVTYPTQKTWHCPKCAHVFVSEGYAPQSQFFHMHGGREIRLTHKKAEK